MKATGYFERRVAGGPIVKERKEAWHVELAQPCRNAPVGKLTKHYIRRNRVGGTLRAPGCRVRRSLNTREFFVYTTPGIVVQDQLAMELSKFG